MIRFKYSESLITGLIFLIIVVVLISCQKVITFDLNSPAPQLVVEANISDMPGPYSVKLSKTVNFDNITDIPAVTGAIVEISDSSGYTETLIDAGNGIYLTSNLKGVPGRSYKLTIKSENKVYESVSKMPYPVSGFNLNITREANDGLLIGDNTSPQQPRYQVNYQINDPENYKNYYRFVVYHKNRQIASRRVFDDQFHNGKLIEGEFGLRDTINFMSGDTVSVELQNIDRGTYDFFRTLRTGVSGLTFLSASPSNPISNISNNGLGYFSAYSVNKKIVIVPLQ